MRVVYKPKDTVKDKEGRQVFAPSFFYKDNMNTIQESHKRVIDPDEINIFDIQVKHACKLYGGEYWISEETANNVHSNDYIEMSIIDKDDILGFFSTYGLDKSKGDILELTKFVVREYVKKGNKLDGYYGDLVSGVNGVSDIPVGLYIRIYYFSHGNEPVTFISKLYKYQ